jgi:hypothetical protein
MGCNLIYSSRRLTQLRTTSSRDCNLWYDSSGEEKSRILINIREFVAHNKWKNTYLYPQNGYLRLTTLSYYWIEGEDIRYLVVDSNGDAWFFKNRVELESSISSFLRLGPVFHLMGSTHYSALGLPNRVSLIPSRYARVLKNMSVEEPATQEENEGVKSLAPYDPIQDILDFEFNKPKPVAPKNPYDLDFEAIAREALK